MSQHIRAVSDADLEWVVAVAAQAATVSWNRESIARELIHPPSTALLCCDGPRRLGYLIYWLVLDEIEIIDIVVAAESRRRGVATQLMAAMLDHARASGVRRVFLEVRESNHAAQALYHDFDFSPSHRRRQYYHDTLEDAIVMILSMGD